MLAPFRCDVDGINNERQIVLRKRNYVVALILCNLLLHGQETRDHTASFPFLNWRPPLPLIEQLVDIFLGISALI